jgi:inner membrane protein YidH
VARGRIESRPPTLPRKGPAPTGESSRIRDHLANERTYLAWLRTGMALLGIAFLVARLHLELFHSAAPRVKAWLPGAVGLGFASLGLVTVCFATWRYLAVLRMIERQEFVPIGTTVVVVSTGALCVALGVIVYVLAHL